MEDIEKIMNEIEELQQEMTAATQPQALPEPALSVVEPAPADALTAQELPEAELEKVVAQSMSEAAGEPSSEDLLNEFRSAGHGESEASLHTTLGDLSEETPGAGAMSLLDEPVEGADGIHEQLASEAEPLPNEEDLVQQDLARVAVMKESHVSEGIVPEEIVPEEIVAEENISEEILEEPIEEVPMHEDSEEGSLTLQLKGKMTLKLKYEFEGQEVTVGFSDGGLKVMLADGTEFKVPVAKKKRQLKRVA